MKTQTKQELLNKLESLYSAYYIAQGLANISTNGMARKSDNKPAILVKSAMCNRAIAWRNYANKLHTALVSEYGVNWYLLAPSEKIDQLEAANHKSTKYWLQS